MEQFIKSSKKAVVVLSGGQDSATCLALACSKHSAVSAITFNYGQKHVIELDCASALAEKYGASWRCLDVRSLSQFTSALTGHLNGDTTLQHPNMEGIPASFVPVRNAIFLSLAHGWAQELNATAIYTGVCQTDYSGYPDCRQVFITQLQDALNTGYLRNIKIKTPLMYKTKAQTFELAAALGALDDIIQLTHTCYNGVRDNLHPWGYGCGECPACTLRMKGWEEFNASR